MLYALTVFLSWVGGEFSIMGVVTELPDSLVFIFFHTTTFLRRFYDNDLSVVELLQGVVLCIN